MPGFVSEYHMCPQGPGILEQDPETEAGMQRGGDGTTASEKWRTAFLTSGSLSRLCPHWEEKH